MQRHTKLDGSVVTEADIALQRRLQQELARHWPEYDFLGEEMAGHEQEELMRVCTQKGLWCLDALDGTSNFAAGVPYFAVSLALLIHCRPELGLVYDPVRDECFTAQRGQGAWLNGLSLGTRAALELPLPRCIAAVDFKRLAARSAARLARRRPTVRQRNFGASSLDWCWLADGRFHVYLHGGQKLWDYAAGHLILAEAGGRSQTLAGERGVRLRTQLALGGRRARSAPVYGLAGVGQPAVQHHTRALKIVYTSITNRRRRASRLLPKHRGEENVPRFSAGRCAQIRDFAQPDVSRIHKQKRR